MKRILIGLLLINSNLISQVTVYDKQEETIDNKVNYTNNSYYKLKVDLEDALVVGTGMVYGEKSFTDNIGLEVGVGITYISLMNYYMFSLNKQSTQSSASIFFGQPESTNIPGVNVTSVSYPSVESIKYKPGFAISVSPKIYLEDDPTEGFFLGIQAAFKNYNFQTPSGENSSQMINQSFNKFNLSFNVGNTLSFSDHFITETFMGIGVSFVNDVRNAYYNNGTSYRDVKVTFSPTRFHYQVGARLCYVF